jgi:light-regulated signal transduction histidine kinase (bacteriophytochrome)
MTGVDAQIQSLQRALQAKDQALSDFTYTVSHDLKANLRHIKAYLGILRDEMGDALQPEWLGYVNVVDSAAHKMQQQIDGLMTLAQMDQHLAAAEPLPMATIIDEARQGLTDLQTGRHIQWHMAPDFPVLLGDSSMVRQVWQHLLHNALKFTRSCDVANITLGSELDELGQCWCFVQDNGVGFNPSQSTKLFKVFQKLQPGDEGLGLGLALTRKLVERQGGQVKAKSLPEQGSWFGFSLPAGV